MKNKFIFYAFLMFLKYSIPQEKITTPSNITNNITAKEQPKKEADKTRIFRLKMIQMAMQKAMESEKKIPAKRETLYLESEQISKNLNNNQEKQQKLILEKNENEKDHNDAGLPLEERQRLQNEQRKKRALENELMWERLDMSYSDEEREQRKADRTKRRAERVSFWEKLEELPLEERKKLREERKRLLSEERKTRALKREEEYIAKIKEIQQRFNANIENLKKDNEESHLEENKIILNNSEKNQKKEQRTARKKIVAKWTTPQLINQ